MKCPAALLALLAAASVANAAPVDSHITAVTVYTDRAVVTRTAEVAIDRTGVQEVDFVGLPVQVMDSSLQVSGQGAAQATILDVSAKVTQLASAPSERIKALEDEIAGLQRDRQQLTDREGVLRKQEGYLGQIAAATTQPEGKDQVRTTIDEWTKLLAFMDDQHTKLVQQREDLNAKEQALDAKIAAKQRTLDDLRGAGVRSAKDVVVRLDASSTGKLQLTLNYALGGASWAPSYDARLNSGVRKVEVNYQGLVRNATGEDWNDVALTLSTAQPSRGGSAPKLTPWVVDVFQPRPVAESLRREVGGMPADQTVELQPFEISTGLAAKRAKQELTFGARPANYISTNAAAVAQTSLTSATFRVQAPATLKADGTVQKVSITTAELPVTLEYQVTPKLVEAAFLDAKAKNSTDYPLLAGPLNAFLDGAFVATSRLDTVMPGESFDLALGADEGIAVKRKLVNRFTESVGLTSRTTRVTYEYLVALTNTKKTSEHVVMSEPLPVSRNEKIEVTLLTPEEGDVGTASSPKTVTREDGGKLVWRLELAPGEKREIPLKFRVEYPTSLQVTGLE